MVVAHAVVAAEAGETVTVLIDDGAGSTDCYLRDKADCNASAPQAVQRDRSGLLGTLTILERAAGSQHIPDKATMRDVYERLRGLDDGLPPVQRTNLLSVAHWR